MIGLKDISKDSNRISSFEYNCTDHARIKLSGFVEGRDYSLGLAVFNTKGMLFYGTSSTFSPAKKLINLKIRRIMQDGQAETAFRHDSVIFLKNFDEYPLRTVNCSTRNSFDENLSIRCTLTGEPQYYGNIAAPLLFGKCEGLVFCKVSFRVKNFRPITVRISADTCAEQRVDATTFSTAGYRNVRTGCRSIR